MRATTPMLKSDDCFGIRKKGVQYLMIHVSILPRRAHYVVQTLNITISLRMLLLRIYIPSSNFEHFNFEDFNFEDFNFEDFTKEILENLKHIFIRYS